MNKYTNPTTRFRFVVTVLSLLISHPCLSLAAEPIRVFIFAGQSNMVGSDSKVDDIDRFPPFEVSKQLNPMSVSPTRLDASVKQNPMGGSTYNLSTTSLALN